MRKNKNLLVVAALCVMALAVLGLALLLRKNNPPAPDASRAVRVYVNGELYTTARLGDKQEITVRQEDGQVNVIGLDGEGVWMESSTCRNQLCVQQGKVTPENYADRFYGTNIICLPNRVTVELVLNEGERDPDAPDI